MGDFRLKWRFTDPKYDLLPQEHLDQLQPLDKEASKFLFDYISNAHLHDDIPFRKDFFRTIDKMRIQTGNESEVKKWLYHRGLPFDKKVFLLWNEEAMMLPWKLLIKYFDSFYYSGSDDLSVFDQGLSWALMFFHEDEVYFGTNKDFIPEPSDDDFR